jgi:hypothetical protein
MSIALPVLDLAFGDYVLCSILLALLYGFAAFETALRPLETRDELIARESAVTWAFWGILMTLLAGVAASVLRGSSFEIVLPLAPLFFVGRWAAFYRESSRLIKSERIQEYLDQHYSSQLLEVLRAADGSLTHLEIYSRMRQRIDYAQLAEVVASPLSRALLPKSLSEVVAQWLLTEPKVAALLNGLQGEGKVRVESGSYIALPAPASAKPGPAR